MEDLNIAATETTAPKCCASTYRQHIPESTMITLDHAWIATELNVERMTQNVRDSRGSDYRANIVTSRSVTQNKLRNFSLPKRIILLCGATRYSEYVVAYVTLEKRKASSDFASLVYAVIFCKRLVNPYTRSQHFPLVDVHRFAQISVPIGFAVPSMGYLEDINNPELNPLEAAYFLQ
ncbi:hypothetical protein J6590_091192, partial [Homalodisca vitripennis]